MFLTIISSDLYPMSCCSRRPARVPAHIVQEPKYEEQTEEQFERFMRRGALKDILTIINGQYTELFFDSEPAVWAIYSHRHDFLQYLIANGIGVNDPLREGYGSIREESLLHYACVCDAVSCVKVLLKNKDIDINIQDRNGMTPLGCAVRYRQAHIVRLLVNAGADRTFVHPRVLQDAYDVGQYEIYCLIKDGKATEKSIEKARVKHRQEMRIAYEKGNKNAMRKVNERCKKKHQKSQPMSQKIVVETDAKRASPLDSDIEQLTAELEMLRLLRYAGGYNGEVG